MEWNAVGTTILVALILLWNLDFIVALLNLGHLRPEPPPGFEDFLDADRYRTSQNYVRESARFSIVESSVSLAALLVFWFLGGFGWLDAAARSLAPGPIAAGLVFLAALFAGNWLVHLPLSIWSTFVLEEKYGFNRTSPKTFTADQLRTLLLAAVLGLPLLAALLWIFKSVDHAWLWAWLVFTVFQLTLTALAPSLILPLFNKFEPMPAGPLRDAIERMAEKCGFPLGEISIMDGSKRSTKANAYFTGFGKMKRIALYDTLVEEHTQDELVAVLAHEIGHFKRRHILQRLAISVVQTAALFFLLGLILEPNAFSTQLFSAFGVPIISAHVGLVLFSILFSPVSRLLGIAFNALSRRHEFEADAFARQATGNPEALGTALKKLSAKNLSNLSPHPLRVWLDHSHPPVTQRLQALGG